MTVRNAKIIAVRLGMLLGRQCGVQDIIVECESDCLQIIEALFRRVFDQSCIASVLKNLNILE